MTLNISKNDGRFYILDMLRFMAAISVVLYHYLASGPGDTGIKESMQFIPWKEFPELYPVFKFGFLGVNLFFVISGFVIFASAYNRTALQFAVLRWIRLFPTYWAAMTLTILSIYLYNSDAFNISTSQILANLTMLNNYLNINNIDPVYWTLQVEIQFYALIFILLLTGAFNRYKIWLSIWVILCVFYALTSQPFFFPWLISQHYSPYFIAGIIFYIAKHNGYDRFLFSLLVTAYCLSIYDVFRQVDLYTINTTHTDKIIGAIIITTMYLIFYYISVGGLSIKKNRKLLILGGLTYPLYLIHLVAGRRLMDYYFGSMNNYLLVACTILTMLFVAYIMNALIDIKLCSMLRNALFKLSYMSKKIN